MRCKMVYRRHEVSNLLKRFVNGNVEDWEFDDFITSKITDPIINKYRIEIADLPSVFPAENTESYVSSEGIVRILEISDELAKPEEPES